MADRTILEVKQKLAGERLEFVCTPLHLGVGEAVLLYKIPHGFQIEDLLLPDNSLSFGYFWANRPYNAYHWLTPQGQTLGLYVNISDQTHVTAGEVSWRDLLVDMLITPDGRCRVLDEDEVPGDLEPVLLRKIKSTRDILVQQYKGLLSEVEQRSAELLKAVQL